MATNAATTVEQESDDLTTCCVCMEVYNEGDRKPKFLSCFHTYCITCVKRMARRPSIQVTCPKCKVVCVLPREGPDALSTNVYVLNNIQLKNLVKNQHSWCLDCEAIPKPTCEGNHSILDRMEDVEDIKSSQAVISVTISQAIEIRQQIEDQLKAVLADNGECLKKLRSLAEKKQLSTSKSGTASAKKRLEELLKKAIKEVEEAERMRNSLKRTSESTVSFKISGVNETTASPRAKKRKLSFSADDVDDGGSYYKFPSARISFEPFSSSQPLRCRNLVGYHSDGAVNVVEFSDDGSYFVSGGGDGRVLLWPTIKAADEKWTPESTEIQISDDVDDDNAVFCLAMSPDNRHIFRGGQNKKLSIYDVNTKKMINSIEHPSEVYGIALQSHQNENNFATVCPDGIVRLFDTRRNGKDAVSESVRPSGVLHSIMFSPADPTVFVVASEYDGALIYDVRNLKKNLYSFPNVQGTYTAQFNGAGTRLLCFEDGDTIAQSVVYDLPTRSQPVAAGKVVLMDPDFNSDDEIGSDSCCFAGSEDDSVISGCGNGKLFIWSLPERGLDCTVNRSLRVLLGHRGTIRCIRYSDENSSIISCSDDGIIKLWTSTTR